MIPGKSLFVAGALLFAVLAGAIIWWASPLWLMFYHMSAQMKAGQRYMDAMTLQDRPAWIERTRQFLEESDPKSTSYDQQYGPGGKPVPSDLAKLKVLAVRINADTVEYVWLGGMDHTELAVTRDAKGTFTFIGTYDDKHEKPLLLDGR